MDINRRGLSLFFRRAIISLSVCLIICLICPPCFAPVRTVSASWAGWDGMDTIAIIPSSDVFLDTAAQELETYLEEISGRSWTRVQGDAGGPAIRLDVDPAAPEFASRGDEAVRLVSDASGIRITGKTSIAVRHGAYILLETLGVRWFFKNDIWTVTPDSIVDIGARDEIHEPSYSYRVLSHPRSVDEDASAAWNRRNRLIGPVYYDAGHTYSSIISIDEYSKHPEYFTGNAPSTPWQLNPENEDVIDIAAQYARDYLDGADIKPAYGYDYLDIGAVQVSPRDGAGFEPPYDESDRQEITDKVFYLTNEVAKIIGAESGYDGKYVAVYNYYLYGNIPSFELEPNLLAWIVLGTNYTTLSYLEKIDGMYAKGVLVGIREFLDEWVWEDDSPMIDFGIIKRAGWYVTRGARLYLAGVGDGWGSSNGLTQYLIGKLLFDHTLDVDDLFDDFCTKSFGPAAAVMKHYLENRETDSAALQSSFSDLDEAETLAAGNDAVLARIRFFQYYERYVWKWHNIGIENLSQEECKDFYTFITKIRDLYVVFYRYVEADVRDVLTDTWGLSEAEVDALQDFTEPTAQEASDWMDEALVEFVGYYTPYINPRKIELTALGNTTEPELDVMHCWFQDILVPAADNEEVSVLVKGTGTIQWFDPTGLQIDAETVDSEDVYTTFTFTATSGAGNYILHSTRSKPSNSAVSIDVPGRPASQIASPLSNRHLFEPDETTPRNAPSFWFDSAVYFYVPPGTTDFYFGASVLLSDRHTYGTITDPDDNETAFDFDTNTEIQFAAPVAGVWKIDIDNDTKSETFWLRGIPPLVWHDPEYLLVQGNSAPVAKDQSVITTVDAPIDITLSASDLNGDPLTYAIVTSPSQGVLSGTPPVVTYTPNSGFVGIDHFLFTASDGTLTSNIAYVSITVNPAAGGGGGGGGGGAPGVTPVIDYTTTDGKFTDDFTAESEDGKVILYFAEDTIGLNSYGSSLRSISIKESDSYPGPPEYYEIIPLVYYITPDGATFEPAIGLSISYDESLVPEQLAEKNLVVATCDISSNEWEILESIVDTENDIIKSKVSHFSLFAVLAPVHPASFTVTDLSVIPDEVYSGEEVSVSAIVTNTGSLTGTHEVSLVVNAIVAETREVTLDGGDSELVTFSLTADTLGEYVVEIGALQSTSTVNEPEAPAEFITNSLKIDPIEVTIGEEVTVSVLVTNTSDLPGSYKVNLLIDGSVVQTREVTLNGEDSEHVSFQVPTDTGGEFEVNIDGLSGSYIVKAPSSTTEDLKVSSFNITPLYNPDTGKLVSAKVVYKLNKSYDSISEEELWLKVFQREVLLEETPLLQLSQLQPDGMTGEVYYVPSQGWQVGVYSFQAELYGPEGEGLIQVTQQEHIDVKSEAITQAVSWQTLGILVGAIFISILAIVGLVIYRKRDMLRGY